MRYLVTTTMVILLAALCGAQAQTGRAPYQQGIGYLSIVGFGEANTNGGNYAVIAGGITNINHGEFGVIGGGRANQIIGFTPADRGSAIVGGEQNLITNSSAHSTIYGGFRNMIGQGRYSMLGGWENRILGSGSGASNAGVLSGWAITNGVQMSVICGGWGHNIVYTNNLFDNNVDNSANFIGGGGYNTISGGKYSSIVGGDHNIMLSINANATVGCAILSGVRNIMHGGYYTTILGGSDNRIGDGSAGIDTAAIITGTQNTMHGGGGSWIGGGNNNLNNGGNSVLLAGTGNEIRTGAGSAIIGVGTFNIITNGQFSTILNGESSGLNGDKITLIGSDLHSTENNTVHLGFSDATKTKVDAAGLVVLGDMAAAPGSVVNLTADNQSVSTVSRSYIRIQSDNATAGNRTWVFTQGSHAGQLLTLEWVGTNAGELVDDSAQTGAGNHRLASTWTPTQYDTLSLVYNGTDWVERGRSTN